MHEHQVRDEFGKVVGYRNLDQIGKTLAPENIVAQTVWLDPAGTQSRVLTKTANSGESRARGGI